MYSLSQFGKMLLDDTRVQCLLSSLRAAIDSTLRKKEDGPIRVLDLGAGFGFFAIAAALMDRRVAAVALDPSPLVKMAGGLAKKNGIEIKVFNSSSFEHEPEKRYDIIIADIHGRLPIIPYYFATLIDARERLLAQPGGILIPSTDSIWAVPCSSQKIWDTYCEQPWQKSFWGVNLESFQPYIRDTWTGIVENENYESVDPIAKPKEVKKIDHRINIHQNHVLEASFDITKAGMFHGYYVWFVAELYSSISLGSIRTVRPFKEALESNFDPLDFNFAETNAYNGPAWVPLADAVEVNEGDKVSFRSLLTAATDGGDYVWNRETQIFDGPELKYHALQDNALIRH